jgi:hypothetical protein
MIWYKIIPFISHVVNLFAYWRVSWNKLNINPSVRLIRLLLNTGLWRQCHTFKTKTKHKLHVTTVTEAEALKPPTAVRYTADIISSNTFAFYNVNLVNVQSRTHTSTADSTGLWGCSAVQRRYRLSSCEREWTTPDLSHKRGSSRRLLWTR